MNPAGKKILAPAVALALAALLLAGSVALVAYWFSTGFVSIGSPSNRDLIETPIARDKSAANDKPAANASAAFRVPLIVIPGAARPPAPASVGPAGTIKPASSVPQIATLPQVPALPQPIQISAPQAVSFPEPIETLDAAPFDLDIALHPSLEYAQSAPSEAIARPSGAALDIPIAVADKQTAALAPSIRSAPPPKPAVSDSSDAQTQQLIEANLKMEKDRRFVMAMCEDKQGRLWVGCEPDSENTDDGGVQCFDPSAPPLHQWTQYTVKDGLGDNSVYAVACDGYGRIWLGHLNHGVSVFNGHKFQNYEVVGGLSKPDSLSGPIGERIFHITVCPQLKSEAVFTDSLTGKQSALSGSVWMCTSAGLSIYFPSTDSWSYLTRADGLPSDQANSLAFGGDGTAYLGTQCDGIAIADSSDGYKSWRTITGPDVEPSTPSGDGLPTNLINDLLVAADGTVYAATDTGLAWSRDRGRTWQCSIGTDRAFLSTGSRNAPARSEQPGTPAGPNGGQCTCLAEDVDHHLWVGHRGGIPERFDENMRATGRSVTQPSYLTAILQRSSGIIAGSYGDGLLPLPGAKAVPRMVLPLARRLFAKLPSSGTSPQKGELRELLPGHSGRTEGDPATPQVVALADDWQTEGSWIGRYGKNMAILCAMGGVGEGDYVSGGTTNQFAYFAQIGPSSSDGDYLRYFRRSAYTGDPKSLEMPDPLPALAAHGTSPALALRRQQAEWDDHGESYPMGQSGPDIFCALEIPNGAFMLSLYAVNKDGHAGKDRFRDYELRFWDTSDLPLTDAEDVAGCTLLAHSRMLHFWGGVYKRVAVKGPGRITIQICRNHSFNTLLSAIMLDHITKDQELEGLGPGTALDVSSK